MLTTGFKVRGEYNAGTAYNPGNVVTRNGYVYVASVDTTGNSLQYKTQMHNLKHITKQLQMQHIGN